MVYKYERKHTTKQAQIPMCMRPLLADDGEFRSRRVDGVVFHAVIDSVYSRIVIFRRDSIMFRTNSRPLVFHLQDQTNHIPVPVAT
jgi:hypothetical protein